jgi:branched-chain amino acid transport system substrate-binding protein
MRLLRAGALLAAVTFAILPAATAAADPFPIDVIVPLTGTSAFLGKGIAQDVNAVEALTNRTGGIGGRAVHFVVHDDGSSPQLDLQLANDVIARHGTALIGPASVAGCRAIVPLLKDGPMLFCLSPGLHPEKGSFAFSANSSTDDALATLVRFLIARGVKRVAVITTTDATGQDADNAIDGALSAAHATDLVVDREHFNGADLSVAAQVSRMKVARPEWVIVWTTGTALGTALRGIKDGGIEAAVITSNGNSNREILAHFADVLPKDLIFPTNASQLPPDRIEDPATRRAVRTYLTAMSAAGVAKPDESNGGSFDGFMLVVDAYRKIGTNATAVQLRDELATLRGFVGVMGPYDFPSIPQRGLGQSAVVITRWDGPHDQWVALSRAGGAPLR